jgi:hypothetical protein
MIIMGRGQLDNQHYRCNPSAETHSNVKMKVRFTGIFYESFRFILTGEDFNLHFIKTAALPMPYLFSARISG